MEEKVLNAAMLPHGICINPLNWKRDETYALASENLTEDIFPDGKAYEWLLYDLENRQVMALDEFNIRPEKEADLKIVDWDSTYFLIKYYMI